MDSSSGFGSTPGDKRAIHTRFRCGSAYDWLNRPPRVTRRIILQKARRQPVLSGPRPSTARKQTVSGSISLPSPGYFSPFPHGTMRYRSLRVCSLGRWAPQLHAEFLVFGATQEPALGQPIMLLPGCHGLRRRFPDVFGSMVALQRRAAARPGWSCNPASATPAGLTRIRFRLPPVRSVVKRSPPEDGRVAPFGNRRINARSRLPPAYRSNATSFIGTQRRGIHPLLIVSSLKEDLITKMILGRRLARRQNRRADKKTRASALGKVRSEERRVGK